MEAVTYVAFSRVEKKSLSTLAYYCLLLLTAADYSLLLLTTAHYCSLLLTAAAELGAT